MSQKPSVSIITISQLSRHACLQNLCSLLHEQTYSNITEWVIVEGSREKDDGSQNKQLIEQLESTIPIKYIEYSNTENRLSDLRNMGNMACCGDIIVCCDDDDYYPKCHVETTVKRLSASKKQIAGCSAAYMYDYTSNQLYKFNRFGPNHSTNNCLAYKREYLANHRHESGLKSGEEMSFTNGFSEPMIQLEAKHCIVISSHTTNTFDKRPMCAPGSPHIRCGQLRLVENAGIIDLEQLAKLRRAIFL